MDLPDEELIACIGLCVMTAGYIAIDVCGREWPGEENLRKIAHAATKGVVRAQLRAQRR